MGVSWREETKARQKHWTAVQRFKANGPIAGLPDGEEPDRKQVQHTFFSKKQKWIKKEAQLRWF